MKRIGTLIATMALIIPLVSTAQSNAYEIDNFEAEVHVLLNGQIEVKELIDVNFTEPRHGIFRTIPYRYKGEVADIYTEVSGIEVHEDGQSEPFELIKNDANITIKIGDPNETITGSHTYQITYTVNGVLQNVGSEDELYWNVTGNNWDTTIQKTVATLYLPKGVKVVDAACYIGESGSIEPCQIQRADNGATFTGESLLEGEGLTAAISWPAGAIPFQSPHDPKDLWEKLLIIIPLGVLLIGSYFWYRRWERYGKDPKLPEAIVTEFEPPHRISPLQAGIILDNRADTIDVSAMIVELAQRGYLTIEEIEGGFLGIGHDYKLTRTSKSESKLSAAENLLLKGLFTEIPNLKSMLKMFKNVNSEAGSTLEQSYNQEVRLGDLKNSFYKTLAEVKKIAQEEVHTNGYYTQPLTDRIKYFVFIPIAFILLMFVGSALSSLFSESLVIPIALLSAVAFSLPAAIYAYFSPQLTEKGAQAKYHLLGYKQFIETAEKYRAKFYEDQNIIFEVMPYAIMFGLAEKFAKKIEAMAINIQPPIWYAAAHPLSIGDFSRNMSAFSSHVSSVMASAPSGSGSGGGGSSGGGFGGGGGGSW